MIDLHCHILPALDDGAVDLADSIAMARLAAADGVNYVCATPHIRHDHDVKVRELPRRVMDLNIALEDAFVPVKVLSGGEVAETAIDGLDDADLRHVSLGGGGGWVLVEPRPGPLSDSLDEAVATLDDCGMGCVIAHPERHLDHDSVAHLERLVRGGALIQVTAAALLEPSTAPMALDLAARRLVHLLGSDSHSARYGRTPALSEAFEVLRQVDRQLGDWIAGDAPEAIVRGARVDPPFLPAG